MSNSLPTSESDISYINEIKAWRADREQKLRANDGWITLCALTWLNEGDNTIGSDELSDIVLPASSVPAQLGKIHFNAGVATLIISSDTPVQVDSSVTRQAVLRSDENHQTPSYVTVGDVTFFVIKRGEHYGIRARDKNSPELKAFGGCTWFDVNPNYRVTGKFTPHVPARQLPVMTIVGITEPTANPGTVSFELDGQAFQIEAFEGGKNSLFIVFRDATAGKSTYGSSRFLSAPIADDGTVALDFNKAFNPPCAFTVYAACPLPLPSNILALPIEAGECYSGGIHE